MQKRKKARKTQKASKVGKVQRGDWNMQRLGVQLMAMRLAKGWSQSDLARYAHVSRGSIQAIERATSTHDGPGINTICRLLYAMNVKPRDFFGRPAPEDFKELPFHYDPEHIRFYELLAAITNSDRQDLQVAILSSLIHLADAVERIDDPLSEEQKSNARSVIAHLLNGHIDGAKPHR